MGFKDYVGEAIDLGFAPKANKRNIGCYSVQINNLDI